MSKIVSTQTYIEAILDHKPLVQHKGRWKVQGKFGSNANVIKCFNHTLDDLENIPVQFGNTQLVDFQSYINAAESILRSYQDSKSKKVQYHIRRLNNRLIGLKYRLEGNNGGLDKEYNGFLFNKLKHVAEKWKGKQEMGSVFKLYEDKLEEACYYPEFIKNLLNDTEIQERFFKWTLKNGNHVDTFIQFPKIGKVLRDSLITPRIGSFNHGDHLKLSKEKGYKDLTLPFEVEKKDGSLCIKQKSILDDSKRITFKGGYQLPLKKIFNIFKNKRYRVGNLEFFPDAIRNWNIHKWAWYDARKKEYIGIDFKMKNWWEQLPKLLELTPEEATRRYGKECDGKNWIASIVSSRERMNVGFGGVHAHLEIAIPNEKGIYTIYNFGKYATRYPRTVLEFIEVVARYMKGTLGYFDENLVYRHREHKFDSCVATEELGRELMKEILQDQIGALEGKMVFHLLVDNCVKWTFEKMEKVFGKDTVPNKYTMRFVDMKPKGVLGKGFALVRKLPYFIQNILFYFIFFLLGGFRTLTAIDSLGKKKKVSIMKNPPWRRGKNFFHPGISFN